MVTDQTTATVADTDKKLAYLALAQMPEAATLEQMSEELGILAAIRRGERAADEGRVVSHAELEHGLEAWAVK